MTIERMEQLIFDLPTCCKAVSPKQHRAILELLKRVADEVAAERAG